MPSKNSRIADTQSTLGLGIEDFKDLSDGEVAFTVVDLGTAARGSIDRDGLTIEVSDPTLSPTRWFAIDDLGSAGPLDPVYRVDAEAGTVTFGDGYHNNHHRYPRSAFHGLRKAASGALWLVLECLDDTVPMDLADDEGAIFKAARQAGFDERCTVGHS